MAVRINLARSLLRLGEFIQSLPVVVMKPDDLVEFSRQTYAKPNNVEAWVGDEFVDAGLNLDEQDLLKSMPELAGKLLLLGVGGGREAIPLARMGFQVTGVDYVPEMVDRARQNAARHGVSMDGLVQDISRLDVQASTYDLVWLSRSMYSCVPTRARRVDMVRQITRALKPGGFFLCQFNLSKNRSARRGVLLRRVAALCTLGNLAYQEGDTLWQNIEFIHEFGSEDEVRSELEEGGLSVLRFQIDTSGIRACAVSRKSL